MNQGDFAENAPEAVANTTNVVVKEVGATATDFFDRIKGFLEVNQKELLVGGIALAGVLILSGAMKKGK